MLPEEVGDLQARQITFGENRQPWEGLHEHFIDPIVLREGRYMPPTAPGFSIEMRPDSIAALTCPDGSEW
ncbi:MAG: hypothetical protein HY873_09190, partial [Chloroflexi bacterium]|nr:hypothetical protein [Chloroflexota bacterium]